MGKKRDFTERAKSGPGKATKKQNDPKFPKTFGKQGMLKSYLQVFTSVKINVSDEHAWFPSDLGKIIEFCKISLNWKNYTHINAICQYSYSGYCVCMKVIFCLVTHSSIYAISTIKIHMCCV